MRSKAKSGLRLKTKLRLLAVAAVVVFIGAAAGAAKAGKAAKSATAHLGQIAPIVVAGAMATIVLTAGLVLLMSRLTVRRPAVPPAKHQPKLPEPLSDDETEAAVRPFAPPPGAPPPPVCEGPGCTSLLDGDPEMRWRCGTGPEDGEQHEFCTKRCMNAWIEQDRAGRESGAISGRR